MLRSKEEISIKASPFSSAQQQRVYTWIQPSINRLFTPNDFRLIDNFYIDVLAEIEFNHDEETRTWEDASDYDYWGLMHKLEQ